MESIGYAVSNKFILIAVDTKLELNIRGNSGEKTIINIDNARKVYKISDTTAISITGLPHKISNIFKYILSIKNSDKSYDSVVEDLESIFNMDGEKAKEQIEQVQSAIPRFVDSDGVIEQDKLFNHFKDDPDLLLLAKESISLMQSGGKLGTNIFLFSHENGRNFFGKYISMAFNLIGSKQEVIAKDNIYFCLDSAKIKPDDVRILEGECLKQIQPHIIADWEENKENEKVLKEKARELLIDALTQLSPFKLTPNIIVYELSDETDNIFSEPEMKLRDIEIN
jgi:hypothetical protein